MSKNKALLAFCSAAIISPFYVSLYRVEYVETIVHSECNRRIAGFFNKTLVEGGYQCIQNGQVLEFVSMTPEMIPSPVELLAIYLTIVVLGVGLIWIYFRAQRWNE